MSAPALQTNTIHHRTSCIQRLADPAKRRGCGASCYILQLPSVLLFCFASTDEREMASSFLLLSRYSDAMFVVARHTHPHGNRPVARLFAGLFLLGTPGSIKAYVSTARVH